MSIIHILDENTINQIAAGEVVERPRAVVKELIENAIDAGATAITTEIKEGGLSLIRITDNGSGISREDLSLAFMRHATSKIKSAEDLFHVHSLGFRGEALSSIAAVSQVELITKEKSILNGYRYIIEGGKDKSIDEIGCPSGTTIIVRNLFYNTPARRKFLKSPMTEAGYVNDLMERLMVSHPNISFRFIVNNQLRLQSSGNNNIKDILYNIYGRDISRELLAVEYNSADVKISGYIGKPTISRGNRNFENYFINGRFIKNNIITKAIEDAYKPFMMNHKYPFISLYFEMTPSLLDVNVHPQKMELKLNNSDEIYNITYNLIKDSLSKKELIPKVSFAKEDNYKRDLPQKLPEPFEDNRINSLKALETLAKPQPDNSSKQKAVNNVRKVVIEQMGLFSNDEVKEDTPFLSNQAVKEHRILGQIFSTYWLVEYQKELYIIDQHAAHEKVLYERIMNNARDKQHTSQMLMPPIVLTLSLKEQEAIEAQSDILERLGYEIEHFGGNEFSIRAVPAELYSLSEKELFLEFIDEITQEITSAEPSPEVILGKIASLACKAAVKANHDFSAKEAASLINELLTLENPYNCPHGRPVIIAISQYELEKKFKRII